MRLERLQQMIIQLVAYWILLISKTAADIIAADLSKQKALDADSRAIQQIISTGEVNTRTVIYYIPEQSKETTLEPLKGIIIVLQLHTNGWIW